MSFTKYTRRDWKSIKCNNVCGKNGNQFISQQRYYTILMCMRSHSLLNCILVLLFFSRSHFLIANYVFSVKRSLLLWQLWGPHFSHCVTSYPSWSLSDLEVMLWVTDPLTQILEVLNRFNYFVVSCFESRINMMVREHVFCLLCIW